MQLSNNQQIFLALVRAGLWVDTNFNLNINIDNKLDWGGVYQLAEKQSVIGLVLAGMEHTDAKPPQELLLRWIGEVQLVEQRNKAMNSFVAELIGCLRKDNIYAILVKGQGVAQCYEKPLWRTSGDIDLLLSDSNYKRAKNALIPFANSVETEAKKVKHLGMCIDGWIVELHGSLKSGLLPKMDKVVVEVVDDVIFGGNVRSWTIEGQLVHVPAPNNDVFLVFTHIIKHFFRGGIGFRQICDWCRLLWMYKEALNIKLLSYWIESAGILSEWKAFAAFAVNYMGMPVESIPLYSSEKKWAIKAEKIIAYMLSVGNFGHNRENIYRESHYAVRKAKAFGRRVSDAYNHFSIFPIDSMVVFVRTIYGGIVGVANGR